MVKQAAGVLIQPLVRSPSERVSRRLQVYQTVLDAIHRGVLPPGARLPSARQLAADWSVARGAVDEAFAQLQIEGYLERRVGDGTYVTRRPQPIQQPDAPRVLRPPSQSAQQVLNRFSVYLGKPKQVELPHVLLTPVPLFPRAPMIDQFPLPIWRRLMMRALGEPNRAHLSYGAAAGLPELREAIARHLSLTRATLCSAQQVLVLNSPMQAIELIGRVLLEPGDKVWLEDPGHASLVSLFQVLHAKVVGVPLDARGLDVAAGRQAAPDAAAVYLHPLTQFPLGVRTDSARRAELLQWADESGAWIIEGNFNDEIAHDGAAPVSFQAMDRSDRVLLMGTFEGIMFPSLRLAYLVIPERLVEVFVAMRGLLGDHTNASLQIAMAAFIDEGHMSNHLRLLREVSRERRDVFVLAAQRHLPDWAHVGPTTAGTHACLHLPPDVSDLEVVRRIREHGVMAIALSSTCWNPRPWNGLVLGYGAFAPGAIEQAMRTIARVLREMKPSPSATRAGEKRAGHGAYQAKGEKR
jgi:GntR family transcriptional regulator/MocR family aminotransferase